MIQDRLDLSLYGQASQRSVHCLAAHNTVLVFLRTSVRCGHQVLDAGFTIGDWIAAEEAAISLEEEEAFELLHSGAQRCRSADAEGGRMQRPVMH